MWGDSDACICTRRKCSPIPPWCAWCVGAPLQSCAPEMDCIPQPAGWTVGGISQIICAWISASFQHSLILLFFLNSNKTLIKPVTSSFEGSLPLWYRARVDSALRFSNTPVSASFSTLNDADVKDLRHLSIWIRNQEKRPIKELVETQNSTPYW